MKSCSLRPYLSIIVPIYNTEKYLGKCIDSILNQTYRDYELILVDDGSTDRSPAICDYYAGKDQRIKVIHKKNRGVMCARKAGLMVSCGEYISFVDSDDWMEPDFYSIFMNCCQSTQADIIVASGYQEEKFCDGKVQNRKVQIRLRQGTYHKWEIKPMLENDIIQPALWLKLFKRELISKNIGLIDNRVFLGEDRLCSYACMLDAESLVILSNYLYHYLRHKDSATHKHSEKSIQSAYYFAHNLKRIRNIKKACFLDLRWNKVIIGQVLNEILCEFRDQNLLLSRWELRELKRKFKNIKLSALLIEDERKTAVSSRKTSDKLIFLLYSLKLYRLLNLYIKVYIEERK